MRRIKLKAPGKINWTLDVTGKRGDGYHEVEMLMQSIGLWDEVTLTERSSGISITGNWDEMPLDDRNIAVKAAKLIRDHCNINSGVHIDIRKEIPVAAGLAGGSTNASAVLIGLNALWSLGLSGQQLEEIGVQLGADVPFCLRGGTAVARGIGEKLTSLEPLKGIWLILIKPSFGVSTASVYGGLKLDSIPVHPNWQKVYSSLQSEDFGSLQQDMVNVLEMVTAAQYPEIHGIRQSVLEAGAVAARMTGSGPTVFGVFHEQQHACSALHKLKKLFPKAYLVETLGKGVEIIEGGSHEADQCNRFGG
jgi:4-diphosphocytidyl-2-C-methyl-D-erythritol kinase